MQELEAIPWRYRTTAEAAPTAPVAHRRVFAGRRLQPQLVDDAARLVATGLVLPALTTGSVLPAAALARHLPG
ncbi:hypothetical protein ACWCXH_00020 [Kitasatospora sp. NPDC001660]